MGSGLPRAVANTRNLAVQTSGPEIQSTISHRSAPVNSKPRQIRVTMKRKTYHL
jgi:hypothetical protein